MFIFYKICVGMLFYDVSYYLITLLIIIITCYYYNNILMLLLVMILNIIFTQNNLQSSSHLSITTVAYSEIISVTLYVISTTTVA